MGPLMRLIGWLNSGTKSHGDVAYQQAMAVSSDLLNHMREVSSSKDPVRAVMADIWQQHHNVPFMTSVVETVEEMKAPIKQSPTDK